MGNPRGQGVVVYVKPEASCAPEYMWIWINKRDGAYALGETSRSLTPELRLLSEASPATLHRVGADADSLRAAIRLARCRVEGNFPEPPAPPGASKSDLLYGNVTDSADWSNPYLVVLPDGVDIRSRSRPHPFHASLNSLQQTLAALPEADWPYGRVVGLQQASITRGDADDKAIRTNMATIHAQLTPAGMLIRLWP